LIKAGVDRIVFSVDGATKEVYEKIRKGEDMKNWLKILPISWNSRRN
jgi:wyosine [tRNA(Phe)-imidazoG37] synthetase (radical SAM superfamily)